MATAEAIRTATGTLERISESAPGERGHRAAVLALVLRYIARMASSDLDVEFLRRRAETEVAKIDMPAERAMLSRLLMLAGEGGADVAEVLSEFATLLEEARRLPEADAVMSLAFALEPSRADFALRAGRICRLSGERDRALALYRVARSLDQGDGSIARLAAVGEAVVADEPVRELSRTVRDAIRSGDGEAAAVGLEERATFRRLSGDRTGAARDLAIAAARYTDPVDRSRVAHRLADLFVVMDDPASAREALLFALRTGDRSQKDHARARLHTVARDMDDQLGMRRWRSYRPPALVSLSSRPGRTRNETAGPVMARWRHRIESFLDLASR